MTRRHGTVKWFDTEKGWGFIRLDDGEEVFVHHSDIRVEGFRSLKDGAAVELEVEHMDRGPRARNVDPLERAEAEKEAPAATTGSAATSRTPGTPSLDEQLRGRLSSRFRLDR